jgi:hypothetical protein
MRRNMSELSKELVPLHNCINGEKEWENRNRWMVDNVKTNYRKSNVSYMMYKYHMIEMKKFK